jgi:predicted outer membrane repeat protein
VATSSFTIPANIVVLLGSTVSVTLTSGLQATAALWSGMTISVSLPVNSSIVTFQNCKFASTLSAVDSTVTIIDTLFSGLSSGALFTTRGTLNVIRSNFTQNTITTAALTNCGTVLYSASASIPVSTSFCGGSSIRAFSPAAITVTGSLFDSNIVRGGVAPPGLNGGAILIIDTPSTQTLLESNTFSNNSVVIATFGVAIHGNALFIFLSGILTVRNCTFLSWGSGEAAVSVYSTALATTSYAIMDKIAVGRFTLPVFAVSNCNFTISNSNIANGALASPISTLNVVNVKFSTANITILNSSFKDLSVTYVISVAPQTLIIDNCIFQNISVVTGLNRYDTTRILNITNSLFTKLSGTSGSQLLSTSTMASSSAFLFNNTFVANNVTTQGTLYVSSAIQSLVVVSKCTFMNNVGTVTTGGLYLFTSGNCIVEDSSFINNTALNGAGIFVNVKEQFSIINSEFINNTAVVSGGAGGAGGAIYFYPYVTKCSGVIDGSIFENNTAFSTGGAMMINTDIVVNNSTFNGNSAIGGGGAIIFTFVKAVIIAITNSRFNFNKDYSVIKGGGGLYFTFLSASIVNTSLSNVTFNACTSTNKGGAIFFEDSPAGSPLAVSVEDSLFLQNSADAGGAIYSSSLTTGSINSSHFNNNYASSTGGAISTFNAQISIFNTILENNSAGFDGGGIWVSISPAFIVGNITNSTFNTNSAIIGNGGALYLSASGVAMISSCEFNTNSAISASGGAIFLTMQAAITVIDCNLYNNSALQGGAVLTDLYSTTTFISTTFESNTAIINGGATLSQSESTLLVVNSSLTLNEAANGGAFAITGQAQLSIQQTTIANNYVSGNGGGIYVILSKKTGYPHLMDVLFIQNSGVNGGGVSCGSSTSMICNNCSFVKNTASTSGGAVYMESSCEIAAINSTIQQNKATSGGGIYCDSTNSVNISTCKLDSNIAVTGGALQWGQAYSSTGIQGTVPIRTTPTIASTSIIIVASTFMNNIANIGGALDINFENIYIQNSLFTSNNAIYGAGLYFLDRIGGIFSKNTFSNNNATIAGGGYFWDAQNSIPFPNCVECIFQDNFAGYSANYATGPFSIAINASRNATIVNNSHVGPIILVLLDRYGNIATAASIILSVQVSLLESDGQLYGSTIFYATKGIIEIPSININGYFYHNYTLVFSMDGVQNASLVITYNGCDLGQEGYYLDGSNSSYMQCRDCATGFYNLNGDNTCYSCPNNAQCSGDTKIAAATNYWLLINNNGLASTYDCPAGFCGSGGECTEHRSGILCGHCEEGYQNSDGTCIECKKTDPGSLFSNLLLLWIFITALQLVSKAPEGKSSESVSGLTKIVVFFVQTIPFVMTPAHKIAKLFSFFNFQLFFNVASKCSFKADFYQNFLIYNFLPAILFAFLMVNLFIHFIAYLIARCTHHRWEKYLKVDKSWYIRTMTSLLSFSYTTITQNVILYLNCRDVGDYRVVASNPDVSCRTDKYHHYSALAYILLALYVLAFPIALAAFLYCAKLKKWFDNEKFSTYVGLMYQPFRPNYYFWEVVILVRRLIVIGIYVLAYSTTSARNLGLFCFSLLMLSIHVITQPFASKSENNVETALLMLLTLLAGAGSSYASQQYTDEISTFTSVVAFMAVIPVGIAVYQLAMALLVRYHIIRPTTTSAGTPKTFLSSSRQDLLPHETPTSPSTETTRSSSPTHKHVW